MAASGREIINNPVFYDHMTVGIKVIIIWSHYKGYDIKTLERLPFSTCTDGCVFIFLLSLYPP